MADIKYIIPFTYKWEGGLSRATSDKASAFPSPYTYQGKTGWHTNKGVTYEAFKSNADRLGYKDTSENFLNMPEDIWLKIAKQRYWDKVYTDDIKSQAVANIIFSWMWGSWLGWTPRMQRYLKSKGIEWNQTDYKLLPEKLNSLVEKEGEKKIFDELIEQKKEFLLSLNQPANEKGWLNRLEDLKKYSYTLFGLKKKGGLVLAMTITVLLIVSGYVLYKTLKTK